MAEYKVRVSSKGRVVIPLEIREQYKISAGTELTLKPLDVNRLVVERVPRLSEFFGAIGSAKATKLLEQERERESKAEREMDEKLRRALWKIKDRRR